MKLMTAFYLRLLIALFMQNILFNELNNLQKIVSISFQYQSISSQEARIASAHLSMSPLSGATSMKNSALEIIHV